jgi:hypothetical protein
MSVVRDRSGKIKVSTLVWLIIVIVAVYYAFAFGGVWWRNYKLEEVVEQQLSYAGQSADDAIRQSVLDEIAAMDLPREGFAFYFRRVTQPRALEVRVAYVETVNLVFTKKKMPMSVQIRRPF